MPKASETETLIKAAGLPPKQAIAFFKQKTLLKSKEWGEVFNEAHSKGFAVAGVVKRELLAELKRAVKSALERGETLQQFRKTFNQITQKYNWNPGQNPAWRAQIIYNTNLATAYSAGTYSQLDRPVARAMFPYWRYCHHISQHPRLQHEAWDGTILPNDDPWWSTHYPPNGWRCHCTIEPVSKSELGRKGWEVSDSPEVKYRDWVNKATGKVEKVPEGIDPSFGYNPGQAWQNHTKTKLSPLADYEGKTVTELPQHQRQALQRQEIQKLLNTNENSPFNARTIGTGAVEAGNLPVPVQKLLKTQSDRVILSDDTVLKQLDTHPELTAQDYEALPELINQPVAVLPTAKSSHIRQLAWTKTGLLSLIIKKTADGTENYLESFYPITAKTLGKIRRQYGKDVLWGRLPVSDKPENKN